MKRIKELPMDLAERYELPTEMLPGASCIMLCGSRQAKVEGHKGVLEYSQDRIVIALKKGKAIFNGAALRLKAMNGDELVIAGRIDGVELQ